MLINKSNNLKNKIQKIKFNKIVNINKIKEKNKLIKKILYKNDKIFNIKNNIQNFNENKENFIENDVFISNNLDFINCQGNTLNLNQINNNYCNWKINISPTKLDKKLKNNVKYTNPFFIEKVNSININKENKIEKNYENKIILIQNYYKKYLFKRIHKNKIN